MGAREWDRACSKRYACVLASLAKFGFPRLTNTDGLKRERGKTRTGALGAAIDDVPLVVRELRNIRECSAEI